LNIIMFTTNADFDYNCLLFNVGIYNFNVIPFFLFDPVILTYTLFYEFSWVKVYIIPLGGWRMV